MERATHGTTISELARRAGVKLPTVRFYERRGMLPKPRRSALGHRLFDGEDLLRIRFIRQAQGLGFSLEEVKAGPADRPELEPREGAAARGGQG